MPLEIRTPQAPGHEVTLTATDPARPGVIIVSCSCGEALYEADRTTLATAHEAIDAVRAHMRRFGWRDPEVN